MITSLMNDKEYFKKLQTICFLKNYELSFYNSCVNRTLFDYNEYIKKYNKLLEYTTIYVDTCENDNIFTVSINNDLINIYNKYDLDLKNKFNNIIDEVFNLKDEQTFAYQLINEKKDISNIFKYIVENIILK